MRRVKVLSTVMLVLACTAWARHDIRDYGAIANDESYNAELVNQEAFKRALVAANSTSEKEDREVYVPTGLSFNLMPVWGNYLRDLTITIDGTIKASKRHNYWPLKENKGWRHLFDFEFVTNLKI